MSTTPTIILSSISKRSQLSVKNVLMYFLFSDFKYEGTQTLLSTVRRIEFRNSNACFPKIFLWNRRHTEWNNKSDSIISFGFLHERSRSFCNQRRVVSGLRKDLSSFGATTLCVLGKPNQDSIFVSEARKKKVLALHRNDDDNDLLTTLLCSLFSLSKWWWTVAADDVHSCLKHSCLNWLRLSRTWAPVNHSSNFKESSRGHWTERMEVCIFRFASLTSI